MLKVENLVAGYEEKVVIKGVSFKIKQNQIVGLYAPNGAGKSTLLNVLAGFLEPLQGNIFFNGENITKFKVEDREFGYISQNDLLFPHYSIEENVKFGLKARGENGSEIEKKFSEIVEYFSLYNLIKSKPNEISGGERQRAIFARTLILEPKFLLLDEPTSNVDKSTKNNIIEILLEYKNVKKISALYVSHDESELFELCDNLFYLTSGKVMESGLKESKELGLNRFKFVI